MRRPGLPGKWLNIQEAMGVDVVDVVGEEAETLTFGGGPGMCPEDIVPSPDANGWVGLDLASEFPWQAVQ